ncbi:lytic transglycosylase domain-containing protein [Roseicyclus marinus]|uniref:lytic transglycosylase domain-containing protein n=1 Tax=Roseicyclus marinus TaxID=2161673 RepID=UPI0024106B60|nr:lytic transglycosylase domain-containing protein [Roseicyclus marinus]MDG3042054.1 lytic transglycosylase domain-containing protein [Roseicyclus marinus]
MRHLCARAFPVLFACLSILPVHAQGLDEATGQGASIRRVTAPDAGRTGPRITIQITAEEHARNTSAPDPTRPSPVGIGTEPEVRREAAPGRSDWFWQVISPALPADTGRFWAAQDLLASAPEAAALNVPRLSTLHRIIEAHGAEILMASIGTEVSPALVLAVLAVESAGRPEAVSPAGAQGLMQLIPDTAARFGVADPFDARQNIAGGIAYLDWLLDEFDGDPLLALAGYNAGEGAVQRNNGVPPFEETRDYVPKVLATWMVARSLCRTPPELISDGCVFQPIAVN